MINKMSNDTFLGYALEGPGEEEKLWKGETLTEDSETVTGR